MDWRVQLSIGKARRRQGRDFAVRWARFCLGGSRLDDDKTTASPDDRSSELDSPPSDPAPADPSPTLTGPPPSQFASSLWGTNQWEESEWAPASSGLSAAIPDPAAPAAAPVEDSKPQPPRLTAEQYATSNQVIGGYEILKPLGEESDGLFLARHAKQARVVSLKALTLPDVDDPKLLLAFVTRARAAARLQDPQLLEIHDFIEQGDKWFAVTEPVFGESLRSRARHAPLSIAAAVTVTEQAAKALAVLRRAHRGHGAVTSRALFIVEREQVLDHVELLDFGAGSKQDELVAFSALAPERKDGAEADARCDVWGLGSVLFELLEGRPPSEARTLSGVSRSGEPIPQLLAELVTRSLEHDPRARFSSVESMASALPHALGLAARPLPSQNSYAALQKVMSAASPETARPRRWGWAALVLGLGVLAGVGWLAQDLVLGLVAGPVAEEQPVELPPPPLVVRPAAVLPPPVPAIPELHPVLLQAAGNKLIAGGGRGALPEIKLKPVVKKKKKKKKRSASGRGR